MKKVFVVLVFVTFFGISLLVPKTSLAGCSAPGTANQCPRGYVGCFSGSTKSCCTVADGGCSQQSGSVQQTPQPGVSDSDPTKDCGGKGISTAIGCLDVLDESGPETFLGQILGWAVGIGGGIAFLLIVYASFMIMTSAGDPTKLKAGQELLTSAISGLILLIFSIFVLRFIGVDILKLDSFGFGK